MAKASGSYRLTVGELTVALADWEGDWGVFLVHEVKRHPARPDRPYLEVVVKDADPENLGYELHRQRGELSGKDANLWPSQFLAVTFEALNALDASPWQWSRKMRRDRVG